MFFFTHVLRYYSEYMQEKKGAYKQAFTQNEIGNILIQSKPRLNELQCNENFHL